MKKFLKSFSFITMLALMVLTIASCGEPKPTEDLAKAKTDAIAEITEYAAQFKEAEYTAEEFAKFAQYVESAKTEINSASSKSAITQAVNKYKGQMNAVPKVDKLGLAKTEAKSALDEYLLTFAETDYLPEEFAKFDQELQNGYKAINAAKSEEEVNAALAAAKEAMQAIVSIMGAYQNEAIATLKAYFETFKAENYLPEEYAKIETLYNEAVTNIKAATTNGDVDDLLAAAKEAMSVVPHLAISVALTKAQEPGTPAYVKGVVIGFGGNGINIEVLIKDADTMDIIGIAFVPEVINDTIVKKGDLIEVKGTLKASTGDSEVGRLYVGAATECVVKSENNPLNLNLDNVFEVNSQETLASAFQLDNYTFVKFTGKMYMNSYHSSKPGNIVYRYHYNGEATGVNDLKVPNKQNKIVAAALRDFAMVPNMGENWREELIGISKEYNTGYPGVEWPVEFTAILCGGNQYYQFFAILGEEFITVNKDLMAARLTMGPQLDEAYALVDEGDYAPETFKEITDLYNAKKASVYKVTTMEEMNALLTSFNEFVAAAPKAVVQEVTLTAPTKVEYNQFEGVDVSGGEWSVKYTSGKIITIPLEEAHITDFDTYNNGSYVVTAKVDYAGTFYEGTYNITVKEATVVTSTVTEVIAMEANATAKVMGVVAGFTSNGTWPEVLIKDLTNNSIVGIKVILPPEEPLPEGSEPVVVFTKDMVGKGDIIIIDVKVTKSANPTETGKTVLEATGAPKTVKYATTVTYDLTTAVEVKNNADILSVLEGEANVIVKFTGVIYITLYQKSSPYETTYLRFHMNHEATGWNDTTRFSVTKGGAHKVMPAFRYNYVAQNIGEDWADDVFGYNRETKASTGTAFYRPGDFAFAGTLYAIYNGGNSAYGQFNIFDSSWIEKDEIATTNARNEIVLKKVEYREIKESDYTPENLELVKAALTEGYAAINAAASVEASNAALQAAKDKIAAIEKIA